MSRGVMWSVGLVVMAVVLSPVEAQEFFPVTVPTTTQSALESPPFGCECIDKGDSVCTKFDCPCVCDLTIGLCDQGCCCDPDCSAAQVDTVTSCLPEGPAPANIRRCIDLDNYDGFVEANPKFRMELDESETLDNILCVVVDNNPTAGTFFYDPGLQQPTIFDDPDVVPDTSFETVPRSSTPALTSTTVQAYAAGDVLVDSNRIPFAVRGPALSGQCTDRAFFRFGGSTDDQFCSSTVSAFSEASCASVGVAAAIGSLRPSPSLSDSTAPLSIAVAQVTIVDVVLGETTVLTGTAAAAVATSFTASSCTCTNAVIGAKYTIQVSEAANTLEAASVDLTVATFTGCATTHAVPFTTSTTFTSGSLTTPVVQRSGNPGYIAGSPLLGGTLVTIGDVDTVEAPLNGLTVPGPDSTGACSLTSPTAVPILVGQSMTVSCGLDLTLAELEAACEWTQPPFVDFNATHLGIFGNADAGKIWQWLAVSPPQDGGGSTFATAMATCPDFPVGLNIRILTASVGELGNPQTKVVGAEVALAKDTWTFTADSTATQRFEVRTTVSFIHLRDGALEEFTPPVPPLSGKLPNNLFHPFDLGGGSGAASAQVSVMCMVVAAVVALLAGWNAQH